MDVVTVIDIITYKYPANNDNMSILDKIFRRKKTLYLSIVRVHPRNRFELAIHSFVKSLYLIRTIVFLGYEGSEQIMRDRQSGSFINC